MTSRLGDDLVRQCLRKSGGARWGLTESEFREALERSLASRPGHDAARADDERFLASLHLEDLALACACARGYDAAWDHFVRECRPALVSAARSVASPDVAVELADTLYADLFGTEVREGYRRSLFDYFHGRSTLSGWLRAVVAQRVVDRVRAAKRFEPEEAAELEARADPDSAEPDLDRGRFTTLARRALAATLAALPARDRLRLSLYYAQGMKLKAIGSTLGESEATASRKLERTRRDVRADIGRRLRDDHQLSEDQVAACFDYGRTDVAFDLARMLPPPEP
jgi:RNA polymerase sigma-70 factor, ECF subfamily